jgi:hypothetical protein
VITVPKLNIKELNKAVRHITKFPETYYQNDITRTCNVTQQTPCGAIGCLGGWLVLLHHPVQNRHRIAAQGGTWNGEHFGVKLLGPEPSTAQSIAGLSRGEALFLFAGADGEDAKKNIKIIKRRIVQIRKARNKIAELNKFFNSLPDIKTEGEYRFKTNDGRMIVYDC